MDLLTSMNWVQSPFIVAEIDGVKLGVFSRTTKRVQLRNGGILLDQSIYPNFVQGLIVEKNANGAVNRYTLSLAYQIMEGNDPNFLEKLFSRVKNGRRIKFSYGDMMNPVHAFREEECLISSIQRVIDARNARINYTVTAVSTTALKIGNTFTFGGRTARPSSVLREIVYDTQYGILDVLPGMKNREKVETLGLLNANDVTTTLYPKNGITVLEYMDYLVSCMKDSDDFIQNGIYMLAYDSDENNQLGGAYLKLVKTNERRNADEFDLSIGYPGQTDVFDFQINENEMYSILYDYSGSEDQPSYAREINDEGQIVSVYRNPIATDPILQRTTDTASTWWTQMVNYPLTATLRIRGLIRPVILTSAVNIKQYFWGQLFTTSGRYIVTSQSDIVDASGYYTQLGVMRVGEA